MKKWNLLNEAVTSDRKKISLWERDEEYTIRVNGADLMTTRQHTSEDKLGEIGCAHLRTVKNPRILIGGLGFGYTLKSVLLRVSPAARITVAELMPSIITWNRSPAYPFAAVAMADRRVQTVQRDVLSVIRASRAKFDSILLDIDNGPSALSAEGNDSLYREAGLLQIKQALRPGGLVAVWSVSDSPGFMKALGKAGFRAEAVPVRAHISSGGTRIIFVGRLAQKEKDSRNPASRSAPKSSRR